MSNGLPDPDSLLTPGRRPVDAVNGVFNALNHTANGFNGAEFIFFPMMSIATDRLRYEIPVYSLVHPHSPTPEPTVNESRPLRFPQTPPFSAPATLLHLPVSHRLIGVRKPVIFSDRKSRRESSCRDRMHPEPCSYPLFFGFPKIQGFSQASQRRSQVAVFQRGPTTVVAGWSLYVDFLSSERWGGPR